MSDDIDVLERPKVAPKGSNHISGYKLENLETGSYSPDSTYKYNISHVEIAFECDSKDEYPCYNTNEIKRNFTFDSNIKSALDYDIKTTQIGFEYNTNDESSCDTTEEIKRAFSPVVNEVCQSYENYGHALSYLKQLLSNNPSNQNARLKIGFLYTYKSLANAVENFRFAVIKNGDLTVSSTACYSLGLIEETQGNLDKARQLYIEAHNYDEQSFLPYDGLFRTSFIKKDYRLCVDTYNKLGLLIGLTSEEFFQLGFCYFKLGNLDKAIECYQIATTREPRFFDAYYYLAITHFNPYKELNKQKISYESNITPENRKKAYLVDEFDKETGNYNEALNWLRKGCEISSDAFKKNVCMQISAFIYKNLGDHDLEIKCYEKALNFMPENINTLYSLSTSYIATEAFDKARQVIDRLEEIDPEFEYLYFANGFYNQSKENFDDAIYDFKNQFKVTPEMFQLHINLGFCYIQKQSWLLAYRWTTSADKLQKGLPQVQNNLRIIYEAISRSGFEVSWLSNALDQNDDSVVDFFDSKTEDISSEDIIQWYNDLLELNPNDPIAHNNIASEYFRTESFEKALEHYKHAIENNISLPEAYYNVGILNIILDDADSAHSAFANFKRLSRYFHSEKYKISPFYSEVFTDGLVSLSNGNTDSAIENFTEVITKNSNIIELYWFRAEAYKLAGDIEGLRSDQDIIEKHRPELISLNAASMYSKMAFDLSDIDIIKKPYSDSTVVDFNIMKMFNEAEDYLKK